jgi:hypothetical protein
MSPVSLVASRQQRVTLPPLLQWLARERNRVRTHRSVSSCAANYVRSHFSQEQWLCPSLLMTSRKIAICEPREIRMVEGHTRIEQGKRVTCWSDFPLQGVHRFKSLRLSDMSIACLWQSSRRYLNELSGIMFINELCYALL